MFLKLSIFTTTSLIGGGGYVWFDAKQSLNLKIAQITNQQKQQLIDNQKQKTIAAQKIQDKLTYYNTQTQLDEQKQDIKTIDQEAQEIKTIQDQIDAKTQQIQEFNSFTNKLPHDFIIERMTKTQHIDDAWAKDPQNIACLKQRTRTTQQQVLVLRCFENLVTQKTTK